MLKSAAGKVMWVGRATVFLVGLAVILALLFGVVSAAFGANGGDFILGKTNVASLITRLAGTQGVDGTMFEVQNNNADADDTALSLKVQANEPPMKINSATRVTDLNADQLDGKDSNAFVPSVWAQVRADGTLLAGKGAAAVQKGGGGYFVRFDRDITNCAYLATVGQTNTAYFDPGEIQAIHSTGNNSPDRDVYVAISDSETGAIERGFSLVVVC